MSLTEWGLWHTLLSRCKWTVPSHHHSSVVKGISEQLVFDKPYILWPNPKPLPPVFILLGPNSNCKHNFTEKLKNNMLYEGILAIHTLEDWLISIRVGTTQYLCSAVQCSSPRSYTELLSNVFTCLIMTLHATSSFMIFFSHGTELLVLSCCSCQRQMNLEVSMKRKEQYNCIPQRPDV